MTDSIESPGLVLIVDDEPTVLNVTKQVVQRAGFNSVTATSGFEAIATLEEAPMAIQCVLLDMSMPEMDGAQTFRELRRLRADLPIVLVSGYPDLESEPCFATDKPFAFLQKPFSIAQIDDVLRRAIEAGNRSGHPRSPSSDASSERHARA